MKRFFTIVVVMLLAIGGVSAQKKVVEELAVTVEAQKKVVEALVTTVEAQKGTIEAIQTEMTELRAENEGLKRQLKEFDTKFDQLAAQVKALNDSIVRLSERPAAEPAEPQYEVVGKLCNGMVAVKEGFLYGFINSNSEYVIEAKYQEVSNFNNGHACVKLNDKWGMIDATGKITVECVYDEIRHYHGTIWRVRKGDLYGLVSETNGSIVQAIKYSDIKSNVINQRARMCINDKWGYFDENGKIVIQAKYDWASSFATGQADVYIGDTVYTINKNGAVLGYY